MRRFLDFIVVFVAHLASERRHATRRDLHGVELRICRLSHLLDFLAHVFGISELHLAFGKKVVHGDELALHHLESILGLSAQLRNGAFHQRIQRACVLFRLACKTPVDDPLSLLLIFALLHFLVEEFNLFEKVCIVTLDIAVVKGTQNVVFVVLELLVTSKVLRYPQHGLELLVHRSDRLAGLQLLHPQGRSLCSTSESSEHACPRRPWCKGATWLRHES